MPTLTENVRAQDYTGIRKRYIAQYAGPKSYATGGDALGAQNCKMGLIESLRIGTVAFNAAGSFYMLGYNYTTGKVVWIVPTTGLEVAAATDLSGYTTEIEALGKP